MVHIYTKKGLNIPVAGAPEGKVHPLIRSGEASPIETPRQIALNLRSFDDIKFRLLVKTDDVVKIGQPLAEDKDFPGRNFVSPAAGVIKEIRRGSKRVLQEIIIDVSPDGEAIHLYPKMNIETASKEEILQRLKEGGLFAKIRQRPFNILANPEKTPRAIFIKAIESAPFMPPAEMQVAGYETEFQAGLDVLEKITANIHLVYREGTHSQAFSQAKHVHKHTAEGPHPIANQSLHIEKIDPIRSADDIIWVLNAHQVVAIGYQLLHGKYFVERVVSIAGPGLLSSSVGYFRIREGFPVPSMISGRLQKGLVRLISGDPLMGTKVTNDDFLGINDYVFCAFKENTSREFLHFFRIGPNKFTASRTYLSGFLSKNSKVYDFTTNQHGEHRAYIDSTMYDKVQPLHIPTMLLVKAVLAEDYDLAETYGLLHVDSEDFALPAFVDPSKTDMTDIIRNGLKQYAKEVSG